MSKTQTTRLARRALMRMGVALATVTALVGMVASPATADVVTDGGVQTNVSHGQTWTAQWFATSYYHPCHSDYFHQTWRVEWNMNVQTGGIYVNSIKLTIWNDSAYGITTGYKTVQGANRSYQAGGYEYTGASNGDSWTRTYNIGGRYFSWLGGNVNFIVSLALPCGHGFKTVYFQLRKNF